MPAPTTTCQASGCGEAREVLVTRTKDGVSGEYCRTHAEAYGLAADGGWTRGFVAQPLLAGLAVCPRCGRLVMNGARHGYTRAYNGGQAACA